MAQHDYVLDNQSGAEFRQDLNNALSAIVSQNSGVLEPSTTYAYMLWADTTSNQLKQRNAANTDWVVLQELDGTLLMENGTASDPGLAFASDKDTGFYRHAANRLGISTGGSSRIVVDDQGQVLFGTTTGSWLSRAVFFGDNTFGTNNPTVTLAYGSANPTDDTIIGDIYFNDSSAGSPGAIIRATADANWGTYEPTRIEFHVSSASASAGEVMRIDSEGRLGLGTDFDGPQQLLHLSNTSELRFPVSSTTNAISFWKDGAPTFAAEIGCGAATGIASALKFDIYDGFGWNTAVNIDPYSRVGIGTTSPNGLLDVTGSNGRLVLANGNTSGGMKITATNSVYNANGYVAFEGYSSEYGRFDSSGRLLVGTSTTFDSNAQFQSVGSVAGQFYRFGADDGSIHIGSAKGTVASPTTLANDEALGSIHFRGYNGTNYRTGAWIYAIADAAISGDEMPTRLVFSTTADGDPSPTERMRITSDGHIKILESHRYFNNSWSTTNYHYVQKDVFGSLVIYNQANTGVYLSSTGNSWNAGSDERLKADLVPITDGLEKVSSLRAVTGRYKTDPAELRRSFLIAQDVQAVLPEAVDVSNPDALGLSYTDVIPLLVAALKESKERIEAMEARLSALEAQ